MIKGVIFDIDGVLLDSMSIWDKAGEMFLKKLGLQPESGLANAMITMSMIEGASFLKERYHLDMEEEDIIKGINQTIEDYYAYEVKLKEGVKDFLKDLQNFGIKIVAATSCDRQVFEPALERLQVIEYFHKIFTCTEVGVGKVKPDIYLLGAFYMGRKPRDIWVFEDALYAIKTASSAGFRTVGVYDNANKEDWNEIKKISDIYMMKLDNINEFLEKSLGIL